jgi:hypothetical protein
MYKLKAHDKKLLPHEIAIFAPGGMLKTFKKRDSYRGMVAKGGMTASTAMADLKKSMRTPTGMNGKMARRFWVDTETREMTRLVPAVKGAGVKASAGRHAVLQASAETRAHLAWQAAHPARGVPKTDLADRAALLAQQAMARHRVQDQKLASLPTVQSPAGQAGVQMIIDTRDDLQQQVATGVMTADDAKGELSSVLSSGSGSAIVAQDQAAADEWQAASEQTLDATEQAATAAAAPEMMPVSAMATAPAAHGGMLVTLALAAAGAGGGYYAAENKKDQTTYAIGGAIAGLIAGIIVGKVRSHSSSSTPAPTQALQPTSATPSTVPPAVQEALARLPAMPPALRRVLTEGSFSLAGGTGGASMKYADGTPVAAADVAQIERYVTTLTPEQEELYGAALFSGGMAPRRAPAAPADAVGYWR